MRYLPLALVFLLWGCPSLPDLTAEESAYAMCRSIPPIVASIGAFSENMDLEDVELVLSASGTAKATCKAVQAGQFDNDEVALRDALRVIRDEFRRLRQVETGLEATR
jgi:hypothetical protein